MINAVDEIENVVKVVVDHHLEIEIIKDEGVLHRYPRHFLVIVMMKY